MGYVGANQMRICRAVTREVCDVITTFSGRVYG